MKGRMRNSESYFFFISQNEIFLLCRMFDLQYDISTLHWKRDDVVMPFPLRPIGKSTPLTTISVVFFSVVESINPTLADISYIRAQNPHSSF